MQFVQKSCFFFVFFVGSCLLLAAKFNDDMKRDKIQELIEVRCFVFVLFFVFLLKNVKIYETGTFCYWTSNSKDCVSQKSLSKAFLTNNLMRPR